MSGFAGSSPAKKRRRDVSVSRRHSRSLRAECADPAAGPVVFIVEIELLELDLQGSEPLQVISSELEGCRGLCRFFGLVLGKFPYAAGQSRYDRFANYERRSAYFPLETSSKNARVDTVQILFASLPEGRNTFTY